ncbi:adenosylcobinamide kinase /adenosylcobinamide-phosphate guanylyltransferase [Pseudobutyrivibrio sp. ACV-2]|uniref:bifunctional adenosylcobinamide kinase/adenosylcobinamide-phosphate guanylyltransferase n=1 Tax=Pseudobutyrivibrio sp. ACV-2 TaxID=1520801 RepID=UPI00089ACFBF|nr:bifunctional adenosylcobinamide kinase/adenosylcobinamide-phosphate guanylyltransferase [Pseudobutyrivibrio sp. ACV-2]SEA58827.1 adenosylcobinamide kinase /adenosylcobinamide-phosphate guanylyltransferase [Pseudobutyrivibrio sp. ACV-2]
MIIFIYGGSGSGKSEFAEDYVCATPFDNRFYLATMNSYDSESKLRIKKHRNQRKGKGFITLEHPMDVDEALAEIDRIKAPEFFTNNSLEGGCIVLLECMSNLVANEMFRDGLIMDETSCARKVLHDISRLNDSLETLVIVSNDIYEDGGQYDIGTKAYLKALGMINRRIAQMAEEVYEVVVGIPIKIKG